MEAAWRNRDDGFAASARRGYRGAGASGEME
jgi:hypothetical protein